MHTRTNSSKNGWSVRTYTVFKQNLGLWVQSLNLQKIYSIQQFYECMKLRDFQCFKIRKISQIITIFRFLAFSSNFKF